MKKVRITVVRKACYPNLMEKYENPIEHACDIEEGQVFIANGWHDEPLSASALRGSHPVWAKPYGLCDIAWETISPFVMALAHGAENFYDGRMKNPRSAMLFCNDGFRPVSFLLEAMDEDAE